MEELVPLCWTIIKFRLNRDTHLEHEKAAQDRNFFSFIHLNYIMIFTSLSTSVIRNCVFESLVNLAFTTVSRFKFSSNRYSRSCRRKIARNIQSKVHIRTIHIPQAQLEEQLSNIISTGGKQKFWERYSHICIVPVHGGNSDILQYVHSSRERLQLHLISSTAFYRYIHIRPCEGHPEVIRWLKVGRVNWCHKQDRMRNNELGGHGNDPKMTYVEDVHVRSWM